MSFIVDCLMIEVALGLLMIKSKALVPEPTDFESFEASTDLLLISSS